MASDTADGTSWDNFPLQVKGIIINTLLQTDDSFTPYAVVSREWQAIFEWHNFSYLKLTIPRLQEFGAMTSRTQHHVRYIWLCLELQEYGSAESAAPAESEWQGMSEADSHAIRRALFDLLETLSTWSVRTNLVLDISVHSPSDSAHWFKYLTFEPDCLFNKSQVEYTELPEQPMPASTNIISNNNNNNNNNNQHHGTGDEIPLTGHSICQLFDQIEVKGTFGTSRDEDRWWRQLPVAPAVTALLLRQQTRRRWKPTMILQLLSQLPRVWEIHYEPWREWNDDAQETTDCEYQSLLETNAIPHLKRLTLFENFNRRYPRYFGSCSATRSPSWQVGRAVAITSLMLEQLSASFIIDASQFLRTIRRGWKWWCLTTLVLTSQLLDPRRRSKDVNNMLSAAAGAAMKMPKLELMEIWNGRAGMAAVFRYRTSRYMYEEDECKRRPSVMTWRATWNFVLTVPVIRAFENVTHKRHGNSFIIDKESVDASLIKSHADAIHHLELAELVIRPVSLRQIRTEHMVGEEVSVADEG